MIALWIDEALDELSALRIDTWASSTVNGRFSDDAEGERDRDEVERLDSLIARGEAALANARDAGL